MPFGFLIRSKRAIKLWARRARTRALKKRLVRQACSPNTSPGSPASESRRLARKDSSRVSIVRLAELGVLQDEAGGEGTPRHSRGCASGARAARRRSSTKRRGGGGGALPCGGGGVSTKRCNR